MANPAGKTSTLEVRCACGESFQNAESYLQHKRLCGTHQEEDNAVPIAPARNRRAASLPARASSPKLIACWCDRTFKSHHALRNHRCHCSLYKQQTDTHLADPTPGRVLESYLDAGLTSSAGERPSLPAEPRAKQIQCRCGQSFANEKTLNKHLRYSKTHRAEQPRAASQSKPTAQGSVPFTATRSPLTSIPSASNTVPGTIPSSVLSVASLIQCTCGHVFETQRVLDLHKRDSLYHKRQSDHRLTRNEQRDDPLISSFASLNLQSVPTRPMPSVARFACPCGRTFTSQNALEQHKRDTRRLVWQDKKKKQEKPFKTRQPQYQEDRDLQDLAAAIAQQ